MKLTFISVAVICYISNGECDSSLNKMNNVIQFQDLNDDVLLEIFHKYDFMELLDAADMDGRFRELIIHYIIPKYKFNERIVRMNDDKLVGDEKIEFVSGASKDSKEIPHKHDYIDIHSKNLTLKLLRNFGQHISRITMQCFSTERRHRFSSYINKYCSESLNELTIETFDGDMLLGWNKPFNNVSILNLDGGTYSCGHNNMNLIEMFPSLRRFYLRSLSVSDSKCIGFHFPHLEHIEFSMNANYYRLANTTEIYENIFDLNPQLQGIHIRNINNLTILRSANEKLHQLETIEISYFEAHKLRLNGDEIIHFENVKRFHIQTYESISPGSIIPFEFDQLEEMSLHCPGVMTETWIEFIRKQQKLKILSILWKQNGMDLQKWMSIIESLPQLEVIKTFWSSWHGDDGVIGVMTRKTNLKKIMLFDMTTLERGILRMRSLNNPEWRFEDNTDDYIYEIMFTRREANV